MSLQSVLAEIKKVKPFAEEDTNSGSVETLNARRGRKTQAVEQLKRLKREYQQILVQNTVFIISTGSGRDEFTKTATEEFGLFAADPEAFYKDLTARVPQTLYMGKQGVSNIFDVLGRHLEDKMMGLDINEYNQLLFKAEYAKQVNSPEEFTQLVKLAINKQIGAEIAGIQAITSLVDVAIEKNHADKITPIVLSTNDEVFALDLLRDLERLTTRVFLAVTGKSTKTLKDVDGALILKDAKKENVEAALTQMRKNLKKMIKKHQTAFNKAFLKAIKNSDRKLMFNNKTKTHDVVVPIASIIKAFRPFIDMVEKDLKIGKHKPEITKTKK